MLKFNKSNFCILLIFLLFAATDVLADNHYQIVTPPDVVEKSISRNYLRAIFGMRLRTWQDGTSIRVFVLPDDHKLHADFSKEKLNLFPYQLRQSWDRLVFSGTGQAPTTVSSSEEMLYRIANTPGAIGYLDTVYINANVDVLEIK